MAQRKKVLLAITQSNFGGAQRYVYDLATSIPKELYEVVVTCGGNGLLKQKLEDARVRVISIPSLHRNFSFSDVRAFISALSIIRRERPDIVHANSSKAGGIFTLAAKIAGCKNIIFTAHGWEFNAPRSVPEKWIIRLLSSSIVALSDTTIAVSKKVASQMPKYAHKIIVIHNGIPAQNFETKDTARERVSQHLMLGAQTREEIWFATIAELHPVKGLSYAIDALAHITKNNPRVRYIVFGDGALKENLERQIKDLHSTEQIHLAGFVENARSLLSAFDAFILPSISEGLAYAILEAGNASLPVIASNTGGIPEVIDSSCGILVPVGNSDEIKNAATYLISHQSDRARLGLALHKRVSDSFTLEQMTEKTLRAYAH